MDSKLVPEKNWFALYVKPQHEFKAKAELDYLDIHNYLPLISRLKQWHDRKKKIDEPLLKGYIFIYVDEKERLLSLENRCIIKCISDHGRPAKIPDWQITNLKNLLNNEGEFKVIDGLIQGVKVKIIEGPFKGVQGIIQKTKTENSLAVSIDLLNRSVIVHIQKESVVQELKN